MSIRYCRYCGKVRYPTYWSAYRVLRKMLAADFHNKGSCYRCHFCHDWHLTHYSPSERDKFNDERVTFRPQKKLKRSRRRKSIHLLYLKTIPQMRQIRTLTPYKDKQKLSFLLSRAFGMVKLTMAGFYGCTITLMDQAAYDLRQSGLYHHDVKRLLNAAIEAREKYEQHLLHPRSDEFTLFDPQGFNAEFREQFADDMTSDMYFDLWKAVGFEAYARYGNHILALNHKYDRYLQRVGCKEHTATAMCMTVGQMLRMCSDAFEMSAKESMKDLPPLNLSAHELYGQMNPKPIEQAWDKLLSRLMHGLDGFTETEKRDYVLAVDTISTYLTDPYIVKDMEIATIADYGEMFNGRDQQRQCMAHHRALQKRIKDQMLLDIQAKRIKNITEK